MEHRLGNAVQARVEGREKRSVGSGPTKLFEVEGLKSRRRVTPTFRIQWLRDVRGNALAGY